MFSDSLIENIKGLSVEDPDPKQDKDLYINSLIRANKSLLALAEKEELFRRQSQSGIVGGGGKPLSHPKQPEFLGDELRLAYTSSTEESGANHVDFPEAQRKFKAMSRNRNSLFSTMTHGTNATNATVRSNKELEIIKKIASFRGGAEWDRHLLFEEEEELLGDDNENNSDDHAQPKNIPWYCPPVQRLRWGEEHGLPHVNWGDLFFDLFYVGAAYNLGMLLLYNAAFDQTELLRCFVYFFGSLGPLWTCWEVQTLYEAAYLTHDFFHRLIEMFRYLCVGMAIFNITSLKLYADPRSDNVMVFTLFMLLELIVTIGLEVELYFRALGDKTCIQNHTRNEMLRSGFLFMVYLAAFILASVQYVQVHGGDDSLDPLNNVIMEDYEAFADGHHHYEDNEKKAIWNLHDLPMTLTAAAYFVRLVLSTALFLRKSKTSDMQEWCVPINVDYVIHRFGEFIMLMIGEGVLSLLIVDTVESTEYYVVVICGILTMIFLHVLKMDSEPLDSRQHALRSYGSVCYVILVHVLSVSLIGYGVSYKAFLHQIYDDATITETEKEFGEDENEMQNGVNVKGYPTFPFFGTVIISLELMNLTHYSFKEITGIFFSTKEGKRKLRWAVVIVNLLRGSITILCLLLNTLLTKKLEIEIRAIAGLVITVALLLTRVLSRFLVNKAALADAGGEDTNTSTTQRAANVTIDTAQKQKVGGLASVEEE